MKYFTYDEWIQLNKHVLKGQKSTIKNKAGIALFSEDQVDTIYDAKIEGYNYEGSIEETLGSSWDFEEYAKDPFSY